MFSKPVKLRRVGGSLMVVIPPDILAQYNLKKNDYIVLSSNGTCIKLDPFKGGVGNDKSNG